MHKSKSMIYREAAKFIDSKGAGSLKSRVYGQIPDKKRARAVFALLSETLKYRHVLEPILEASQIFSVEKKRLPRTVAMVMVYDLLLSKQGRLVCAKCPEKDAILRNKTRLKAELARWTVKRGPPMPSEAIDEPPVRWIRCNYDRISGKELEDILNRQYGLARTNHLATLTPVSWYKDENVEGLYGLHPSKSIAQWPIYKNGQIIIQDRASCFPVAMLLPSKGSKGAKDQTFVDACAAPGNKTTQLAAWSGCHVLAYERDAKRATTLNTMVTRAGLGDDIDIRVGDFTESEPCKVSGIVVDPSCSGSGVFGRVTAESEPESDADSERLARLAEFQYVIMRHALEYDCEAVVYSTCSVHAAEDEQVVRRLLETSEVAEKWQLRQGTLPKWPRRGIAAEFEGMEDGDKLAQACVRVEALTDFGIGFFAACFERRA